MTITSMLTVSWAWIAACVFAGAACTVLVCILLAKLTEPHRVQHTRVHNHHAVETRKPAPTEADREQLPRAA
jgi:type IV secretory pathway component VirB8